jgi:hypothetical protein
MAYAPGWTEKPAIPKPEGQCHWSRPGPKDVNAAISDDPAGRSKRSAATPTRLLRRFPLSRDGQVRWTHRSRNETVESEWPRCRTVESDAAANQRRSLRTPLGDGAADTIRTCDLCLRRAALTLAPLYVRDSNPPRATVCAEIGRTIAPERRLDVELQNVRIILVQIAQFYEFQSA